MHACNMTAELAHTKVIVCPLACVERFVANHTKYVKSIKSLKLVQLVLHGVKNSNNVFTRLKALIQNIMGVYGNR